MPIKNEFLPEEIKNFVENIEQALKDEWMSRGEFSRRMQDDVSKTMGRFYRYKKGLMLSRKYLEKTAYVLGRTPNALLMPPLPNLISPTSLPLIQHMSNRNITLEAAAVELDVPKQWLRSVINRQDGYLKTSQIDWFRGQFVECSKLTPFIGPHKDINAYLEANPVQTADKNKLWEYRRIALSRYLYDNAFTKEKILEKIGINTIEFNDKVLGRAVGMSKATAPPPSEVEWAKILKAVGADHLQDRHLIAMGLYRLSYTQVCELLMFEHTAMLVEGPKIQAILQNNRLTPELTYRHYVMIKHYNVHHLNQGMDQYRQVISTSIRLLTRSNVAAFIASTAYMLFKTVPAYAKPILEKNVDSSLLARLKREAQLKENDWISLWRLFKAYMNEKSGNATTSHPIKPHSLALPSPLAVSVEEVIEVDDNLSESSQSIMTAPTLSQQIDKAVGLSGYLNSSSQSTAYPDSENHVNLVSSSAILQTYLSQQINRYTQQQTSMKSVDDSLSHWHERTQRISASAEQFSRITPMASVNNEITFNDCIRTTPASYYHTAESRNAYIPTLFGGLNFSERPTPTREGLYREYRQSESNYEYRECLGNNCSSWQGCSDSTSSCPKTNYR